MITPRKKKFSALGGGGRRGQGVRRNQEGARKDASSSYSHKKRLGKRTARDSEKDQYIRVKELLYKSKDISKEETSLPSSPDDDLAMSPSIPPVEEQISESDSRESMEKEQPTLLDERSLWKKRILEKNSLVHLLTLEILYAQLFFHSYGSDRKSVDDSLDEIFLWLQDNRLFSLEQNISNELRPQVKVSVNEISQQQDEIIAQISPFLVGWNWDRLSPLRQWILIVAWYHIKYFPEHLSKWLNDAINHAKWFGEDKDYAFVNSILDKLITHHGLWHDKNVENGESGEGDAGIR